MFWQGWGWVSRPHCPSARAAVGAASAASPARPWTASAWPASPAGTGPSARNPAHPASTARAASSCVPAADVGRSATRRRGPARTVRLAGWDPGTPRIRPPVLAEFPCSGSQRADASLSVLVAATAPAPQALSAMDASTSAPSVLRGAATPCQEFVSARQATGEPGNARSGAGLGSHSSRGHFPPFLSLPAAMTPAQKDIMA